MWDTSHMEEKRPLQRFLATAIEGAPEARDHYDKLIQKKYCITGKPIYDIERGRNKNPSAKTLVQIAEALGQPYDLLSRAAAGENVAPIRIITPEEPPIIDAAKRDESTVSLKEIDLGLSMGDGTEIDHYRAEGWVQFDRGLIRSISRAKHEQLFVARGEGDSMFPTLVSGDRVIIDTSQQALNLTDRIWAVSIYGAGGIKRLRPVSETEVEIISDNPAQENQIVARDDLYIIGRVVWLCRDM